MSSSKLHAALESAAKIIDASEFDVQYNYYKLDDEPDFRIKDIDIYFRSSTIGELSGYRFENEERAIEGLEGFVKLYSNVA